MNAIDYLENHWIKNETWTHLTYPAHQERLKYCADKMIGETFVDVGCGLGHSTSIMKRFHSGDWTGIDFGPKAIEIAKTTFPDIKFILLNSINNISSLNQYDSVVCSEVIEHIENDKELIKLLYELAKKILVITTPSIHVIDPGHLRLYTKNSLNKLFENFENVSIFQNKNFFFITICKN